MDKLEHLEHMRSEDTFHCPMITHTTDQFILDPKSKQYKVKVINIKNSPKLHISILWQKFTRGAPSEVTW